MTNVALLARRFENLFNAINEQTVEIYFQRSPGKPHGDARGISGLAYRVYDSRRNLIQQGTTGDDGKIDLRVRGGFSVLKLVHNNTEYATYEVTVSSEALADAADTAGKKERLRLLGYQIGHAGLGGNGVDAQAQRFEYERSVLDFQADQSLDLTSAPADIQARLTNQAGA